MAGSGGFSSRNPVKMRAWTLPVPDGTPREGRPQCGQQGQLAPSQPPCPGLQRLRDCINKVPVICEPRGSGW